ncbi:hypothetical protein REPUB_Repub13aG0249000 [Reevesia pubescens]
MASTVLPSSSIPTTIPNSSIQSSFFPKTSQLSIYRKKKHNYFVPNKVVSCKATNGNQNNGESSLNRFDRRDVLIGLGGLYGATNLANDPFALASPIQAPDLSLCGDATIRGTETVACCPPQSTKIIDFKPPQFSRMRYRPAAHLCDPIYLAKFTRAMELMKALPDDDPRSFKQQANVHCAYCNGAYDQVGFPDQDLQILPWNWDAPAGMPIPAIYCNPISPLYDEKRNVDHQPPVLVDLDYNGTEEESTKRDQIKGNLSVMYRQMVSNKTPSLFHGAAYRAGDKPSPGMGAIENIPHTPIHRWCGDKRQPHSEDMGNFYSAGRDPLFYAHHCNVDRMWSIWKALPGRKRNDFSDPDWLDASFIFYDENANLVRAKVRDCLDTRTLGYDYQRVDIPWLRNKPSPRKFARKGGRHHHHHGHAMAEETKKQNVVRNVFPIVLDKIVRFEIPRPKKSRSKLEKEDEEEVLVLQNIQLDMDVAVKFDVYINDEDDDEPTGPEDSEFAGSFTNLPHNHNQGKKLETSLTLPLSDLLEDLDVEGDDNIVVTLVPKEGKGLVTVGNIKIDYIRE